MFIACINALCRTGRIKSIGFDGLDDLGPCPACTGAGEIELTADEEAIMRTFLAACDASVEAGETVRAIETALRLAPATPLPALVHADMTKEFFDAGVRRAFTHELAVARTSRASVVAVSSSRDADVSYLVTATECQCEGHRRVGRCLHRCLAIWFWWVAECDAVAVAAHTPELVAA